MNSCGRDNLVSTCLLLLALMAPGCDADTELLVEPPEPACDPLFDFAMCVSVDPPDLMAFPQEVVDASEFAAARLAVRRIQDHVNHGGHSRADEPEDIPSALSALFRNAVLHTYDHSAVVRDSLFTIFGLRTKQYPLIEYLSITVHPSQTINSRIQENDTTGIPEADSLLLTNGFELIEFDEYEEASYYWFKTDQWKNYRPVDVQLTNIPQIASASTQGGERCFYGPCHDIIASIEAGGVRIRYTLEWDGCPVGCINHREWEFFVDRRGEVTSYDAQGDSFP